MGMRMYVSMVRVYKNEDYRMGIGMKIAGSQLLLVFLLVIQKEVSRKTKTIMSL